MIRLLPYCLPAALIGAGAYLAADRVVLAEIGLVPGRDGLRSVSGAAPALVRPQRVAQSGPVCFDVMLWGGSTLPLWPADMPAQSYAALVPAPGVSVLPPGDALVVVGRPRIVAAPVSVPEPGSLAVFVSALLGLFAVRKKPWTTEDYSSKHGRRH